MVTKCQQQPDGTYQDFKLQEAFKSKKKQNKTRCNNPRHNSPAPKIADVTKN